MNQPEFFHPHPQHHVRHIGIIPDGGRRWATSNKVTLNESYELTRKKLAHFVGKLLCEGIDEISIYLSSRQNFKRNEHEIEAFTNQALSALSSEVGELSTQFGLKVIVAGNLSEQSDGFRQVVHELVYHSRKEEKGLLNLCIAYDPFDELAYAMENLQNTGQIWNGLWVHSPMDIVVRSGNANLLSNFLPLQSAYARLYFSEKLFNDLEWEDIKKFIDHYRFLDRKYGD